MISEPVSRLRQSAGDQRTRRRRPYRARAGRSPTRRARQSPRAAIGCHASLLPGARRASCSRRPRFRTWLGALAVAGLAILGVTAHEVSLERGIARSGSDTPERESRLAAAASAATLDTTERRRPRRSSAVRHSAARSVFLRSFGSGLSEVTVVCIQSGRASRPSRSPRRSRAVRRPAPAFRWEQPCLDMPRAVLRTRPWLYRVPCWG